MRRTHNENNRDWIDDVDTWLLLDRVEANGIRDSAKGGVNKNG